MSSEQHPAETIAEILDALVPGRSGRELDDLVAGMEASKRVRVVNSRRGAMIIAALRAEPHNLSWNQIARLLDMKPSTARNWAKQVVDAPPNVAPDA